MKAATAPDLRGLLCLYISIHAAREGGDRLHAAAGRIGAISIHAAREGGDSVAVCPHVQTMRISIHAAREGGDHARSGASLRVSDFNPRRP